ncbi:MAG: sialate O-acetylesterase [Luteolibacter sp.]
MKPSFIFLSSVLVATASAKPIAIVNAGFEADPIAGENAPVFEVRAAAPTGWSYVQGVTGMSGLLAPMNAADNAKPDFYPAKATGFEGTRACFFYQNGAIQQTLEAKLEPNTTYTLSVASGTRLKGAFGGYAITLDTTSGTLIGSWRGVNHNIAKAGTFADTTRSFTTGPNPPGAGEKLRITLAQGTGQAGGDDYTDLDNVRLTAVPATARPAKCPVDVFFVSGQSNAHGWKADAAALSPANRHYADAPDPRALLAYAERNLPEPIDNIGSPGQLGVQGAGFGGSFSGFGPELSAGTDLAAGLKGHVAMIKYAIGSAGLEQNFLKTGVTAKPHYEAMLATFRDSLAELKRQGYEPHLKGFFWLQGETDSGGEEAARYATNMTRFITDLRTDLGAPDLRVFLTEINGQMPALKPRAGTAQVNTGMQACAAADPLVKFIPISDISTGFADAIHYSADQEIDIGQRWAKAWFAK